MAVTLLRPTKKWALVVAAAVVVVVVVQEVAVMFLRKADPSQADKVSNRLPKPNPSTPQSAQPTLSIVIEQDVFKFKLAC